ncbi:MAG: hypothetical protein IKJ77_03710 [Firmicutes bacterium]|nr:hypothetical protein [Bacillota bacterium]
MMKVCVQLQDRDFACSLVRGLAAEGRNLCFTLVDADFDEADFDLLLTDRELHSHKEILLCSSPDEERIYEGPPYRIFRFRDAGSFVGSLLYIHYRETGKNLEFAGDVRCRILMFSSLTGGACGTALALAAGEILYRHFGLRCLYLNLCPIDGSKRFLTSDGGKGLLHLLYHLEQERDFPLESFIRRDLHVDCVDTNTSNPYFDELHPLQLHRLLQKIDDYGKYAFLFLDIGNHFSGNNRELLCRSDEIILTADSKDLVPEPFFKEILQLLEGLAAGTPVKVISLDAQDAAEHTAPALLENGLLDLSAMKQVQWEAGRLVKEMMERNHDR